jgi:hypothetical protein
MRRQYYIAPPLHKIFFGNALGSSDDLAAEAPARARPYATVRGDICLAGETNIDFSCHVPLLPVHCPAGTRLTRCLWSATLIPALVIGLRMGVVRGRSLGQAAHHRARSPHHAAPGIAVPQAQLSRPLTTFIPRRLSGSIQRDDRLHTQPMTRRQPSAPTP